MSQLSDLARTPGTGLLCGMSHSQAHSPHDNLGGEASPTSIPETAGGGLGESSAPEGAEAAVRPSFLRRSRCSVLPTWLLGSMWLPTLET